MNYENKFVAFIDILGFKHLIENETEDSIYEILNILSPDNIKKMYAGELHLKEKNSQPIAEIHELIALSLYQQYPMNVTYFSDCLILSANENDPIASQMILYAVASLSVRMWERYKVVLRGAVVFDKIIHNETGPSFGPAINNAYQLESESAIYPRIIIDQKAIEKYRLVTTFKLYDNLINHDGGFHYISLISSLNHFLYEASTAMNPEIRAVYKKIQHELKYNINENIKKISKPSVIEKYQWLLSEIKLRNISSKFPLFRDNV